MRRPRKAKCAPAKARTRKPASPARQEEIYAEILKILGWTAPNEAALAEWAGVAVINMRDGVAVLPNVGFRNDNAKFARRLKRRAEEVLRLLNERLKEDEERTNYVDSGWETALFGFPHHPDETVFLRARHESAAFRQQLVWLQERCDWVISSGFGYHKNVGVVHLQAAAWAKDLCKMAGRKFVYSNPRSNYRMIATWLYEVATGKADRDLERACKAVATKDPAADPHAQLTRFIEKACMDVRIARDAKAYMRQGPPPPLPKGIYRGSDLPSGQKPTKK